MEKERVTLNGNLKYVIKSVIFSGILSIAAVILEARYLVNDSQSFSCRTSILFCVQFVSIVLLCLALPASLALAKSWRSAGNSILNAEKAGLLLQLVSVILWISIAFPANFQWIIIRTYGNYFLVIVFLAIGVLLLREGRQTGMAFLLWGIASISIAILTTGLIGVMG